MKNEALRLFLAITALILTALLTNTGAEVTGNAPTKASVAVKESAKDVRKIASEKHKPKAVRTFAFFYRR